MNILQDLLSLPEGCIYSLHNPNRNKVQLFLCKNAIVGIPRKIKQLRDNEESCLELCNDLPYLQLKILETHSDYSTLQMHMKYWYDYIEALGLETYKRPRFLEYRSRITTGYDYTGEMRILVELVNKRNEAFVVGVFDKMHKAKKFSNEYFLEQEYVYPVYANNELTKEYISARDEEIDRVFRVRF